MKDLIEQLKQNEKPFGLMSEEMQAKAKEIGKVDNFECWLSEWGEVSCCGPFYIKLTYRLRADYTEPVEDEYEECEIFEEDDRLRFTCTGNAHAILSIASALPNFVGYLYEDKKVRIVSMYYRNKGERSVSVDLSDLNKEHREVLRPTHVVFRK